MSNDSPTSSSAAHQIGGQSRVKVLPKTDEECLSAAVEVACTNLEHMERRASLARCSTAFIEPMVTSAPEGMTEEDYRQYLSHSLAVRGLEKSSVKNLLSRLLSALKRYWKTQTRRLLKPLSFIEINRRFEARREQYTVFALLPPVNAPSLSQV